MTAGAAERHPGVASEVAPWKGTAPGGMGRKAPPEVSVEELIRRARAGEDGALEDLFSRCRPTLGAWASRRVGQARPGAARPSDIAQETALRAFLKFSTFSGTTEGEWFAWMERIFSSQAAQSVRNARRKKREAPGAVPLDSPEALAASAPQKSPSQATAVHEESRQLLTCIYDLPDEQREAIWLCHMKELPVAEVARCMEKTEGAVAGLLQRGLRALRHRMAEEPEGAPQVPSRRAAAGALLIYLRLRDAGEAADPEAFVTEHPACEDELRSLLRWMDRIHAIRPARSGR